MSPHTAVNLVSSSGGGNYTLGLHVCIEQALERRRGAACTASAPSNSTRVWMHCAQALGGGSRWYCASRCERVGEGAHTLSTSCSSARHIIMRCERAGRRALIRVDTMERRSCGAS